MIFSVLISTVLYSQKSNDIIEFRTNEILKRFTDTIAISNKQKQKIKKITKDIFLEMKSVFDKSMPGDSTRLYIQRVENKRDILYYSVLDSVQKIYYKKTKRYILFGN